MRATRELVLHDPAVAIIPVIAPNQFVLVQQFRPAADQMLWEIPAGSVDEHEDLEAAAKRELAEETGYGCKKITPLFGAYPSPGFLTEKITVYVAQDLFAAPQTPDADERIQIKTFTQAEIMEMIQNNTIQDFKTIASFLYYIKFFQHGN
jgi:ADP-ribose pyrophosphatase